MIDACIEHLGSLPSQLNLTDDQIGELLAFHHIKRRSQSVCRECVEESQHHEKVCFVCERTFTEKYGPVSGSGKLDAGFLGTMRNWDNQNQMKEHPENFVTAQNFDENKDEMERKFREQCAARGIKMIEE